MTAQLEIVKHQRSSIQSRTRTGFVHMERRKPQTLAWSVPMIPFEDLISMNSAFFFLGWHTLYGSFSLEGSSSSWRVDSFHMLLHITGVVASLWNTINFTFSSRPYPEGCLCCRFLEEQRRLILLFSSLFTNPAGLLLYCGSRASRRRGIKIERKK